MSDALKYALRLNGVSKSYDSVRALDGISFDVVEGRFFALFGPSSVGKTTALRTIAGLVKPDSGRVEINGTDVTHAPITGRGLSMVFQSFALYPHLTVFENFAYPLREDKLSREEIAVMRDGAVVQRGTPDELYENPANMYVAVKIGSPHMNMIKAKTSADKILFETSLGKIVAKSKIKTAETGEAAMLGIRPSDIRFAAKGEVGIKSTVQMLEPLGDVTVISLQTGAETLRMVVPESVATSIKLGQIASLYLDHKKFHIFRASSGQAMT